MNYIPLLKQEQYLFFIFLQLQFKLLDAIKFFFISHKRYKLNNNNHIINIFIKIENMCFYNRFIFVAYGRPDTNIEHTQKRFALPV